MSKQDTYTYRLKKGHQTVYIGTTNDPDKREDQHKKDKQFGTMQIVGRAKKEESALDAETEMLQNFRGNHDGKNPRYNKTKTG